jgi:hypothetical protein
MRLTQKNVKKIEKPLGRYFSKTKKAQLSISNERGKIHNETTIIFDIEPSVNGTAASKIKTNIEVS